MTPLVITPGEPAGIGPELCFRVRSPSARPIVIVADEALMRSRAQTSQCHQELPLYNPGSAAAISLLPVPLAQPSECGVLNKANAAYVLQTLERAGRGCLSGEFAAMVTGPVHKGVINDAGIPFSGHTEYLAELTGSEMPVMMLTTPGLRVALVTTHLPLSVVSKAITATRLTSVIRILASDLRKKYAMERPRIAVCGLNPHAGEGGHIGTEEQEIIIPTLDQLRGDELELIGPLPADTAFTSEHLKRCDVVLAMYHDQGLPVLKHKGFHDAVNVTLGLPIIRTSVDHGTALDLAGQGLASESSLQAAIAEAETLIVNIENSHDRQSAV